MLLETTLRLLRVGARDKEFEVCSFATNGSLLITSLTSKNSIEANFFFSDSFCLIFKSQFYFHSSAVGRFLNPPNYLMS